MDDFADFVKRLIVGANDVPFRDAIKAATGFEIVNVDGSLKPKLMLIKKRLKSNLKRISAHVKTKYKGRANELSNYMEKVVAQEINAMSEFKAISPKTGKGKAQSAGYPDLFVETGGQFFYLEVKTFQLKTKDSTLRTFYYKPSEVSKITRSCSHLLVGFEVESKGGDNRSPFIIHNVKILNLYDLKVSLKPEFNANNIDIYSCAEI
ncbi:hypothetical protein COU37_01345 [Candidatus Micrarchaeota archaeon CG10_big_fil_rev_8_21_14_0_10_45_29]|nr:MAG: hypothetical protein COU37_01345 [Candidatus Micrarchaeota archaeon CG10_big_fil_rev_8_21_14_0_10_45_29]